jgi:5-methyltetrahydropteroyltriglutamate--homocysteine methyltransferase
MSIADRGLLFFASISLEERRRIGVHTCPGTDLDSTHSADVGYTELLPSLFELKAGNFYIALAGERDLRYALKIICKYRNRKRISGITLPSTPILRPRKKCATVRSNPARIGAGAGETVNF